LQPEAMSATKKVAAIFLLTFAMIGSAAMAQTNTATPPGTTPPVTSATGKTAVPADLQALVKKFEKERKAYLAKQKQLEAALQNATTPEERDAIRAALQTDRDDFLADLKDIRQDLKQEITELKDKLNNAELIRAIQATEESIAPHHHHGKT